MHTQPQNTYSTNCYKIVKILNTVINYCTLRWSEIDFFANLGKKNQIKFDFSKKNKIFFILCTHAKG